MKAITYCLHLLEPVLVSQAESREENGAIGLAFVPGSALRGALAARYLQATAVADPSRNESFRRLFLDGTVCYLNAYPWRNGKRALPRPLSWMMEKDEVEADSGDAQDWAVNLTDEMEHPTSVRGEFCLVGDDTVSMLAPKRQVNVHISLQSVNVRGDENTVYRYEAIAAGEILAGAIISSDDALLEAVHELLTMGELTLGTAHRVGYGRTQIESIQHSQDEWSEYTSDEETECSDIIVTLLSDTIVRGNSGQTDGDIGAAVGNCLNTSNIRPLQSFQKLQLVSGYNRKWSLPLPQTWALQAGSTFVFKADDFTPETLRQAVEGGIGERRAEGFGRLSVNWRGQSSFRWRRARGLPLSSIELSDSSKVIAVEMANRRLRLVLERKLDEAISGIVIGSRPQTAQLSRVRNAAQQCIVQKNMQPMIAHLGSLKGARSQFRDSRVANTPMDQWIEQRALQLDIERQLQLSQGIPVIAGQPAVMTDVLKTEFTARLIDGVMKKAAKLNQKEVRS